MTTSVYHYFDYKSPYAYLAQAAAWDLAERPGIDVTWVPCTLQIHKYLGEAELNEQGEDTVQTRNDHQWRRVKYSYMDCRREASRRGLIVRGPRKIFDSSISHIAFLWMQDVCDNPAQLKSFHDAVYERFWRRELDIEDAAVLTALMDELGADTPGFGEFLAGPGRAQHDALQRELEQAGVFGVPTWLIEGEVFWGLEKLPRVYEKLGLDAREAFEQFLI